MRYGLPQSRDLVVVLLEVFRDVAGLGIAHVDVQEGGAGIEAVLCGLDLLVRFRVRDHAHLRELLLTEIFTIDGVQRTETFLSLADIEPANFTASLLKLMSERRGGPRSEVNQ